MAEPPPRKRQVVRSTRTEGSVKRVPLREADGTPVNGAEVVATRVTGPGRVEATPLAIFAARGRVTLVVGWPRRRYVVEQADFAEALRQLGLAG